jgi:hypothetical protein
MIFRMVYCTQIVKFNIHFKNNNNNYNNKKNKLLKSLCKQNANFLCEASDHHDLLIILHRKHAHVIIHKTCSDANFMWMERKA